MGRFKLCAQRAVFAFVGAVLSGCTLSDALNHDAIYSVRTDAGVLTQKYQVAIVTDRQPGTAAQLGFDNHWGETVHCATSRVTVPAIAPANGTDPQVNAEAPVPVECNETDSVDGFAKSIETINSSTGCDRVLLYVHGYNTTFRSALLRAGQLAHDAEWPCAAATFSWGSEGQFDRYVADIERSSYAVPLLMGVLKGLKARHVTPNIIAHSMGNRVTLSALSGLSGTCDPDHPLINELILAAPDVGSNNTTTISARCCHGLLVRSPRHDLRVPQRYGADAVRQSSRRHSKGGHRAAKRHSLCAGLSQCRRYRCDRRARRSARARIFRLVLRNARRHPDGAARHRHGAPRRQDGDDFAVRTRTTRPARDRRITTRSWYRRRANSAGPRDSSGTSSPSSSRSNTAFPGS